MNRRKMLQATLNSVKEFQNPLDYMVYFYRFYELIESKNPSDMWILNGKLRQHMEGCTSEMCDCIKIADYLDELQMMR